MKNEQSQCGCGPPSASLICHSALPMSPTTSACGKYTASTSALEKLMWITTGRPLGDMKKGLRRCGGRASKRTQCFWAAEELGLAHDGRDWETLMRAVSSVVGYFK